MLLSAKQISPCRARTTLAGALTLGLLWVALFPAVCVAVSGEEKQPKPLKIVGVATDIQPARVTIVGKKDQVTVQTKEDFTEKVAVGAQVTAWYFPEENGNILQWLTYPLENFFAPLNQVRGQVKKVIILPTSSVPEADGLFDAMANFMETHLGWFVAPRILAEEIRRRSLESHSTLNVIDPATSEVDLSRYLEAQREVVRKVAAETRVDGVLQAQVERVKVNFRSQVAIWDGVKEPVAGKMSRTLSFLAAIPQDGYIPAATVVVKLWDPEGRLLWSHRRGFALLALQVGVGDKFRDRPIPEALQDSKRVQGWLKTLFNSFLSTEKDQDTAVARH